MLASSTGAPVYKLARLGLLKMYIDNLGGRTVCHERYEISTDYKKGEVF